MRLKKYIALLLAFVMMALAMTGCAAKGKTLLKIEKEKITVNTAYLFLSRMKGYLVSSAAYGESARTDAFWDTLMSADGTTYDEYYTNQIIENAKTYAAALHLDKEVLNSIPVKT